MLHNVTFASNFQTEWSRLRPNNIIQSKGKHFDIIIQLCDVIPKCLVQYLCFHFLYISHFPMITVK